MSNIWLRSTMLVGIDYRISVSVNHFEEMIQVRKLAFQPSHYKLYKSWPEAILDYGLSLNGYGIGPWAQERNSNNKFTKSG